MSQTFTDKLAEAQEMNDSLLCFSLDPTPDQFSGDWRGDPGRIFDFCVYAVTMTRGLVCAYEFQFAHFAAHRAEDRLEALITYVHREVPGVPVILDVKRGDVGRAAEQYACEAFERYRADAVTLSPFMGLDSVEPFMRYGGKGIFLLCRTSNPGGTDLQMLRLDSGELLYEHIARLAAGPWNSDGQIGLVVGATYPRELARVRELAPTLPLLIRDIGFQGSDVEATVRAGWRRDGPIIVSSLRAVLYPQLNPGEPWPLACWRVTDQSRRQLNVARRSLTA